MKDTKKILRQAIFDALDGNITVGGNTLKFYDEKAPSTDDETFYGILSTQQETGSNDNDSSFITQSSIEIELIQKTGSEVSKDDIDDAYEQIMEILIPEPFTLGNTVTVPSGFQFLNPYRESCITNTVILSPTEAVITERFRVVFTIVQQ